MQGRPEFLNAVVQEGWPRCSTRAFGRKPCSFIDNLGGEENQWTPQSMRSGRKNAHPDATWEERKRERGA